MLIFFMIFFSDGFQDNPLFIFLYSLSLTDWFTRPFWSKKNYINLKNWWKKTF